MIHRRLIQGSARVSDNFAGAKMDTPEFNQRVGSWAKAIAAHVKSIGVKPEQLVILLVDEPQKESQDAIIVSWAKAIKAIAPKLTLFSTTAWKRPDQVKNQDAINSMDILSPNLLRYIDGDEPVQKYFSNLRAAGKKLWFYQTSGPSWEMDPQLYYRYQAWQAFAANATGVVYAPAYLGKDIVTDSILWDAVREGVEDYEELAMLQDAINASTNVTSKQQAQQILDAAVKTITGSWKQSYDWNQKSTPELADTQLAKVRTMIIRLNR